MIATVTRDGAAVIAYRTTECAACGTRLYGERAFCRAVAGLDRDAAVVALLGDVARWKAQPAVCGTCPERRALEVPA